jgi:hypothetical protein
VQCKREESQSEAAALRERVTELVDNGAENMRGL